MLRCTSINTTPVAAKIDVRLKDKLKGLRKNQQTFKRILAFCKSPKNPTQSKGDVNASIFVTKFAFPFEQ